MDAARGKKDRGERAERTNEGGREEKLRHEKEEQKSGSLSRCPLARSLAGLPRRDPRAMGPPDGRTDGRRVSKGAPTKQLEGNRLLPAREVG